MAVALDTNVLIYLHDNSDPHKRTIAQNLLADEPAISTQVISEYLNTTRRLLNLSKEDLLTQTAKLFAGCTIMPVLPHTMLFAAELVKKYKFNYSMLSLLLWPLKNVAISCTQKICSTNWS